MIHNWGSKETEIKEGNLKLRQDTKKTRAKRKKKLESRKCKRQKEYLNFLWLVI